MTVALIIATAVVLAVWLLWYTLRFALECLKQTNGATFGERVGTAAAWFIHCLTARAIWEGKYCHQPCRPCGKCYYCRTERGSP